MVSRHYETTVAEPAVVFGRESALGCEDHAEGLEEADFLRGDGCHQAVTLPSHNRNLYF
jgi:hypothetical protein